MAWAHARFTPTFGVETLTVGSRTDRASLGVVAIALHGSVVGRRADRVSGSHRRHVCQTPLAGTVTANTSRPFAN